METKICTKCGIEKPIDEFRKSYSSLRNKYYYRNDCRECEKKYYEENKEYFIQKRKEYDKSPKRQKYFKEYNKMYYQKNKKEISESRKEYFKRYRELNKEKIKIKKKEYYQKNKERINKKNKIKKQNDKMFYLICTMRNNLLMCFKKGNYKKESKAEQIIGLKSNEFANYLLQTFKSNYGYEWDGIEKVHIDHIMPLKYAKTKDEIIKLCYYTNLQLLKAEDNLKKGAKML